MLILTGACQMTLYIRSCIKEKQEISITLMRAAYLSYVYNAIYLFDFYSNGITNDLLHSAHRSAVGGMNRGHKELSDRTDQRDFITEIHPSRLSKPSLLWVLASQLFPSRLHMFRERNSNG